MKPIEIITIVACVAIVVGVIVASIVRKLKGKPSIGCDCAGCSHAKGCDGSCCSSGESVDWSELVAKRKQELENQKSSEECCCEACRRQADDAQDEHN